MSNSGTPPTPRPEALKKLAQLRIERLKKEEEEEQWISGEELYTEGSSDEDDMALRTKRKSNERGLKKSSRSAGCKAKKQIKEENKKPQSHLIPQLNLTSCVEKNEIEEKTTPIHSGKDQKSVDKACSELDPKILTTDTLPCSSTQNDEVQEEISWRPKRGSIKLPNLTTEGRVELLGLESKSEASLVDADEAYCAMIETIKKLKTFFMDEFSIFPSIATAERGSSRQRNIKGINANKNLSKLLASDWHFLHERCDDKSALTNMNVLDFLLEIIDFKQKEAHDETLNVQLQIREELSQFMVSQAPSSDEVRKNINSFLEHCLFAEYKGNPKDIKALNNGDDMQNPKHYKDEIVQYWEIKHCDSIEHIDAVKLTMFNKSFISGNEMYPLCVPSVEKNDDQENIEDGEDIVPLTDEEKLRLDELLDDDSEPQSINESFTTDDNSNSNCDTRSFEGGRENEVYAFNEEMKQNLDKINEKLQAFSKSQCENEVPSPKINADLSEPKSEESSENHEK
ncbi:Protein of unknown function [Gryllus bimaculatus]|nr:Protein of unknown function [Gryllus bimaculatus]